MNNKANIKFESVNLFETMGGIVEAHVRAYKEDFDTDKEILRDAAVGPSRAFLWLCRTMGTWLLDERNIFLKATRESNSFRFYQEQTREPIIEDQIADCEQRRLAAEQNMERRAESG